MVSEELSSARCFIIISKGTPSDRNCLRWRGEHVQFGELNNYSYLPMLNIDLSQVDAVGKTSVTLSVKQRIAEGLSRAGTSNTLKVVSYNAILGIISFFTVGAVRQFCVFAIVVLVAHWFLAHTFFMAVLSIDIARLEVRFGFLYVNIKAWGLNSTIYFFVISSKNCCGTTSA